MAFSGKLRIRTRTVKYTESIEQASHFITWGCDVTCDAKRDDKVRRTWGTLKITLNNETRKETEITFYKMMAVRK